MNEVEYLHGVDEVIVHDFSVSPICGLCGSNIVKGICSKCGTNFKGGKK